MVTADFFENGYEGVAYHFVANDLVINMWGENLVFKKK